MTFRGRYGFSFIYTFYNLQLFFTIRPKIIPKQPTQTNLIQAMQQKSDPTGRSPRPRTRMQQEVVELAAPHVANSVGLRCAMAANGRKWTWRVGTGLQISSRWCLYNRSYPLETQIEEKQHSLDWMHEDWYQRVVVLSSYLLYISLFAYNKMVACHHVIKHNMYWEHYAWFSDFFRVFPKYNLARLWLCARFVETSMSVLSFAKLYSNPIWIYRDTVLSPHKALNSHPSPLPETMIGRWSGFEHLDLFKGAFWGWF